MMVFFFYLKKKWNTEVGEPAWRYFGVSLTQTNAGALTVHSRMQQPIDLEYAHDVAGGVWCILE